MKKFIGNRRKFEDRSAGEQLGDFAGETALDQLQPGFLEVFGGDDRRHGDDVGQGLLAEQAARAGQRGGAPGLIGAGAADRGDVFFGREQLGHAVVEPRGDDRDIRARKLAQRGGRNRVVSTT